MQSQFNLNINQAVHNTEVLHKTCVIFTTDKNGNLDYISKFNLLGRIINHFKNLLNGTGEHRVNKVILATFQTINQHAKSNPGNPTWTYSKEDVHGKDYDVGFDKVAMRVLLDRSRFDNYYYKSPEKQLDDTLIKIRQEAYQVMLMATEQRKKLNIEFDCDHL